MIVRLHDYVLPRETRNITVGCGLIGWGPDGTPAKLLEILSNGEALCEFAIAPVGVDRDRAPARFRTSIAGLRTVDAPEPTIEAVIYEAATLLHAHIGAEGDKPNGRNIRDAQEIVALVEPFIRAQAMKDFMKVTAGCFIPVHKKDWEKFIGKLEGRLRDLDEGES